MASNFSDLVNYALERGERILADRSETSRKQKGQFLTPATIARFMARQLGPIRSGDRILDPAIGSGVLACALIEQAITQGQHLELWLDGFELDPVLGQAAREILLYAAEYAATYGVIIHTCVYEGDFVLNNIPIAQPYLLLAEPSNRPNKQTRYDYIIANPPYFKLNSHDERVKAVEGQVKGHTNIYTLFLALAAKKLTRGGKSCFIIPRSFCSGAYFANFRQEFIQEISPLAIHLFESRQDNFKNDSILQENIIFTFGRQSTHSGIKIGRPSHIQISASKNTSELNYTSTSRPIALEQFLARRYGTLFFRLLTGELDEQLVEIVDKWTGSLHQYGLDVSTGPVVAFRAQAWLTNVEAVNQQGVAPLLWMQNVKPQQAEWPILNGNKPQGIVLAQQTQPLLLPAANYVLLRRFSAKEEPRRLIAAPFLADQYHYPWVGLENHLNYIYKKQGNLSIEETLGLSVLFNSALMDRYFRIINGNTQVNATELRALPLPSLELIKQLGQKSLAMDKLKGAMDVDALIVSVLRESGDLPPDFPIFRETRITMGKIQEAQEILKALGLPPAQQNEISALTLLVLAQLSEEIAWGEAKRQSLRIHDILTEIKKHYDREYAENTRETIRRQVIHQFEQAGLVTRNPDDPTLATNSPRTHYALSDACIRVIRHYHSPEWPQAVQSFIASQGTLFEIYQKSRQQRKVPLHLANGNEYHLSPGKHNELQVAIVEEFGPRFAPGATLLYLGDTENKALILDRAGLEELGIPISNHDKLPDIVFYDKTRHWLFLVEAVTSHGPVSPKRLFELEEMMKGCSAGRIYVSSFPDFATFRSFLTEIAWETEVWLAEIPDHLIHFNGDRFLGPRN